MVQYFSVIMKGLRMMLVVMMMMMMMLLLLLILMIMKKLIERELNSIHTDIH